MFGLTVLHGEIQNKVLFCQGPGPVLGPAEYIQEISVEFALYAATNPRKLFIFTTI